MKSIGILVPYFGILPEFFKVWLITAKANNSIDFYIITDQDIVLDSSVNNVFVKKMMFSELKEKISSFYQFEIKLDMPYKLCDYKPAYGEIFQDILQNYDFWGYCDIDLILGDLRAFFTDEILGFYEKILFLGHISLYKNCEKINSLYKSIGKYPDLNYDYVFSTNDSCYFDEYRGIFAKCMNNNIQCYNPDGLMVDPVTDQFLFKDSNNEKFIILWENGKVYKVSDINNEKKELIYAHFFRRKLNVYEINADKSIQSIKIIPNSAIIGGHISDSDFFIKDKKIYKLLVLISNLKKYRYSLLKYIKRRKWTRESDRYNKLLLKEKGEKLINYRNNNRN